MEMQEEPDIVRCTRSFVRASAVAAFIIGVVAFVAYPRSFCTHWDLRMVMCDAVVFAAAVSVLSLLVSSIPWIANPSGGKSRPMCWYNCLNIVTIVFSLLMPPV